MSAINAIKTAAAKNRRRRTIKSKTQTLLFRKECSQLWWSTFPSKASKLLTTEYIIDWHLRQCVNEKRGGVMEFQQ